MGLQDDIIENFFSKLSANDEFPKSALLKLRELFDSKIVNQESIRKIIEEVI